MTRRKKTIQKTSGAIQSIPAHKSTEWIYQFWAWQVLAWVLYRYFLSLPEPVDEFIFKPLIFVLPVLWYVRTKEKRGLDSIGLTQKNFWYSLILGLGFGFLFAGEAMAANALKYGTLKLSPSAVVLNYGIILLLLLSFATAFSEEVLSRGFLFTRLYEGTKKLWYSAFMSAFLFVAFHIPILLTTLRFTGMTLVLFFLTNIVLGVANSIIFNKTKSLVAPILIHLFWNVTVAMFL